MADPLSVPCPDCLAPAEQDCYHSGNPHDDYGPHAERRRIADLRAVEHGLCGLCGRPMVYGAIDGAPARAWHPDEADKAVCPPLPDPKTHWNAYAEAVNAGLEPGYPGNEHFRLASEREDLIAQGVDPDVLLVPFGGGYNAIPEPDFADLALTTPYSRDEWLEAWETLTGWGVKPDQIGPIWRTLLDMGEPPLRTAHALLTALTAPSAPLRASSTALRHVCPECRAGKHRNCDGTAWDDEADQATRCTCADHDHPDGA